MSIKTTAFVLSMIFLQIACGDIALLANQVSENDPFHKDIIQKTKRLQLPFIANAGQVHEKVRYYAHTFGGKVFITQDGEIVYSLPAWSTMEETSIGGRKAEIRGMAFAPRIPDRRIFQISRPLETFLISYHNPISNVAASFSDGATTPFTIHNQRSPRRGLALKEVFVGGKPDAAQGEEKVVTEVNYFKGNDPSRWKRSIPAYEVVNLGEVYRGIHVKLRAYDSNIEKLFYLKPHADPKAITIRLSGAHAIGIDNTGQLEVATALGTVKFTRPIAYQEIDGKRVEVAVDYQIRRSGGGGPNTEISLSCRKSEIGNPESEVENVYGFRVASYDKTQELIIDPLLASTYLGGVESDYGSSIAMDAARNVYVTGYTNSSDFPTTSGAFDVSYNTGDVFVSKLNTDLTHLLASTFLGGSSEDHVRSIALDSKNNVYLAGQTASSNFPIIEGAYDTTKNGFYDAFLVRLSGDLTSLLSSTYLGGSTDECANAIVLDQGGIVLCVTGRTSSKNFPITPGSYDADYKNGDVFIAKFDWNLTTLIASTYLGGTSNDYGNAIVIDAKRNIYVVGETWSFDFPANADAYDDSFNGGFGDAFISKLDWDLKRLLASTYLGGSTDDSGCGIALDAYDHIYVLGQTESPDFPTTSAACDTAFHNGDAFVSKLNDSLSKLLASTFLGGADDDIGNSIAIGPGDTIYVGGYTASSDFPTTPSAYNIHKGVLFDAFLTRLDGGLTKILASTFLGGSSRDIARSFVIDQKGFIYTTGETLSLNFPVTPGAHDTSFNGNGRISNAYDAFVSKLNSSLSASSAAVK